MVTFLAAAVSAVTAVTAVMVGAMKIINIDDFSGGLTNFRDQVLIENNQGASASRNVWAPEGGLTKAPGFVIGSSFTASGVSLASFYGLSADDAVSTAYKLFYRINIASSGGGADGQFPWASANNLTDTLNALGYTTGTVSISGASLISATGSGTLWLANVSANDRISFTASASSWFSILSVEDDTHLTLRTAVAAAIPTGSTYIAQPQMILKEFGEASLNGSYCWTTTGDIFQRYDGTGMLRLAAAPKCAFLRVYKNYMFGANVSTAQSRVLWSAIKDPTSWPVNNFIDVDVLNGKISGLFVNGPELLVFKTRGLYKILGDVFDPSNPQYFVTKIYTPPDFMFNSHRSVAMHGNGVIFYGLGRIYKYITGTNFITDISPAILRFLPTAFGVLTNTQANVDQNIRGINYNGDYLITGLQDPNNSGKYMAMLLDKKGAWWYLSNRNAGTNSGIFADGPLEVIPGTATRPQLACASSTYPKIFTVDLVGPAYGTNYMDNAAAGTASNVAIDAQWVSKEINIDYGTFKWIVIYLKKQSAGNLTVAWSIDQGTSTTQTVDMTVGRGQIIRSVLPINQKGSTIQLTLSNNALSQTFKIYAIKIFYEESPLERLA